LLLVDLAAACFVIKAQSRFEDSYLSQGNSSSPKWVNAPPRERTSHLESKQKGLKAIATGQGAVSTPGERMLI